MISPKVCIYCHNSKRLHQYGEELVCMAGIKVSAENKDKGIVMWKGNRMMDVTCEQFTRDGNGK